MPMMTNSILNYNNAEKSLSNIRGQICNGVLIAVSLIVLPILIVSIWRAQIIEWQPVMYFQIIATIAVWSVTALRKKIQFYIKGTIIVSLFFMLSIGGLLNFALVGGGLAFSFITVIFATVFFGTRSGFVILAVCAVSIAAIGYGHSIQVFGLDLDFNLYNATFANWVFKLAGFIFLTSCVLISIVGLNNALVGTVEALDKNKKELELALVNVQMANQVKSEILANMSHELRTPLNAIIGFSNTIKEEVFGPIGQDQYRDYIDDIVESGEQLLTLIEDILDVSSIESKRMQLHEQNLDVGEIINSTVRYYRHYADQKNITLHSNVDDDLPMLYGDARCIKQIIHSLVSNSVKFTNSGGTVTLNASINDAGEYVFSVADTGIGMSKSELAKATNLFGQIDRESSLIQEGAGVGLTLAIGLAELHGGTLAIESSKNVGSTVTVKLPKERVLEGV